jgi:hypothetical protein
VTPDNFSLEIGDSFLFCNQFGEHLHVIVAESSPGDTGEIMLVYLSSVVAPYRDETTIIEIGEHNFVTRRSWVRYQNVIVCQRDVVIKSIVEHFGQMNPLLFERITSGLLKSNRTPNKIKQLIHEWKMNKAYKDMK